MDLQIVGEGPEGVDVLQVVQDRVKEALEDGVGEVQVRPHGLGDDVQVAKVRRPGADGSPTPSPTFAAS